MIAEALRLIRDELSIYIERNKRNGDPISASDVILHNIADLDKDGNGNFSNKIILSTVNIEEESTLKNSPNYRKVANNRIVYIEPPIYLNLYILFCVTSDDNLEDAYETALNRLSLIIRFFQSKHKFTVNNSPHSSLVMDNEVNPIDRDELRLNMELYTLTFEQINHLWGSLGGKQVPFVMYKVRLVKIREYISETAPVIEETQSTGRPKN